MGIEFEARVSLDAAAWVRFAGELQRDPRFVRLPHEDPARILLRIAAHAPREEWPEDVVVQWMETAVYVLFHGAQGADREAFLSLLESSLDAAGSPALLEEL